ncbi:MAG: hypothetical protein BroJett029_22580 [Alphaproteobacteria bacterium]|nr:MAG: hypothetical protein BroJett029_22580 [Alphaproteobacteria bacterium]
MKRPLRSPKLCQELGPRRSVRATSFRRHKSLNPAEEADFLDLVRRIQSGNEIPDRFYRPRSGEADQLLQNYGVLHLHLGEQTSDTLLFLIQFTDEVLFLETNTHNRFARECELLIQQHKLEPIPAFEVVHKKQRGKDPPKV